MVKAVYPGSFDPMTIGHVDIIHRLAPLYKELVVLIASSSAKNYLFSPQERAVLAEDCLKDIKNVRVEVFEGLTVDYAKKMSATVIIRGLRAVADFEYEMAMANMNKKLNDDVETMITFARPEYNYISSRMVKEVAINGGDLEGLVPKVVVEAIKKKAKEEF